MSLILRCGILAGLGCTSSNTVPALEDTASASKAIDEPEPSTESGSPDDTGLSCAERTPWIEVGTGEDGFVPLVSGDVLTMVHGPQGGWHVLGAVRAWNMGPIVDIRFIVTSVDHGVVVADNTYRAATVPEAECGGLFWGMYGYLDVHELAEGELDTPPELLAGHTLELRMLLDDREGEQAESVSLVRAARDPADVEDGAAP
jgi:hypothetical protein